MLVYFSGWIRMFTGGTIWILTHGHVSLHVASPSSNFHLARDPGGALVQALLLAGFGHSMDGSGEGAGSKGLSSEALPSCPILENG